MADFDRTFAGLRGVTDRSVAYDMGLRTHMIRVYNYMAGGVALTGVVAWLTYQMAVVTDAGGRIIGLTLFGQTLFGSPLKWLIILAPLGFVLLLSFRIGQLQASTARALFFAFAGIFGLSLAAIFMVYTATSITRVFGFSSFPLLPSAP
jgi:FtsH-binding integral membrane protein